MAEQRSDTDTVYPTTEGKVLHEVDRDTNQTDIEEGDILKFDRGRPFFHYGVYVGNSILVHQSKDKGVLKQQLIDVIAGCPFYVDNYMDQDRSPKNKAQIVKDALNKVGRKGYSLFTSNCEHFATSCRYGLARCKQIEQAMKFFIKDPIAAVSASAEVSKHAASDSVSGATAAINECVGCLVGST